MTVKRQQFLVVFLWKPLANLVSIWELHSLPTPSYAHLKIIFRDIQLRSNFCSLSLDGICSYYRLNRNSLISHFAVVTNEKTDVSFTFQLIMVFYYVLPVRKPEERFWRLKHSPRHDSDLIARCIYDPVKNVDSWKN